MSDIIGQKKGGGEQHTHYEATDSLHSISYARVLDLVSEGEILGLAHGMRSVFLNQTPVENADGTQNFKDITVDFRTGTQIQDYIPGFPDVENEIAVGTELRSGTPWTHAVNNLSLSAIRITMSVPALSKGDTTNGDILGYSVAYQIELSTDSGAYAVVLSNSFNGKTTTPYNRSARIDLPAATVGWSIRVTRLTANANTASIADTTTIISYTEVIDAKLRYPMSAIVGVQVDAKQFQSVPTRAYDMYGRIIQVPTNYDPVTRVYTGIWDGTFKPSWTSNPAWIFRDLVLNDRYGLGARISAAQLDKWALYAIAQYCDQLVPNGKGGTEPRFTCNLYLQSQKQAYAVLQDMASIFRGISYWGGGSIIASSDRPMDPVYVYTAANVIGGKFSRVGSSKKTRATVALVSWNDPADFYRAKVEYVEDQDGITRYGIQQIPLTAFGCTSQGQAQRAGRWALATSRLETEAISFEVGMDGAIALPGQIVRIADPARMGRRNGGRVRSAAGRVVTLDKAPIINAGDSLTVILPSGVSETRTVASIAGDAVTVSADWTTVPLAQSVWSVDSSTLMAPTYKILSIKEKGDGLSYAITATQHEPGKFAYIENGTAIAPRPQTSLDVTRQAPPTAVTISAYTVSLNDVQKLAMSVSCAAVAGAVAYEGAYKYGDGNWIPLARQPASVFDVPDIIGGVYTAKLAAVNSIGITSTETVSAATTVTKTVNAIYNASASLSNAQVFAYQRASSAPTGTPGAVIYDFTTGTITTATLANGWQKTIPTANGNPLYVTVASASGSASTDAIASNEWAGAVILAQDGPGGTGTNGLNTATVTIYQRGATSTPPALPSASATYNFGATTPLTGLNNGWSATVPAASGGPFLFVSTATASSITGSDSIPAVEWAAAQLLAQDGATGATGSAGSAGSPGTAAPLYGTVRMYQWSGATPAAPTGTSTITWATGVNSAYSGSDGWVVAATSGPGTPGVRLYVAEKPVTAAAGTPTSSVSYSGANIAAWSQNGSNGTSGIQSGAAIVYQWAATIPSGPAGSATYTWATGAFGAAPTGWALNPGTSPSAGYTLWQARVGVTDSAANATTAFNWTSAAITSVGYAGQTGSSYVAAYCDSTTATTTTTPATTTGATSVPAVNDGGVTGTWQSTVPTSLASGHYMWQSDGIYNPATNQVSWSIPYWSYAKFGSLSAIVANLGQITAGSMDIGTGTTSWHVDPTGNTWAGASTYAAAPYRVSNAGVALFKSATFQTSGGATVLDATGLQSGFEAPGTKNSDIKLGGRNFALDSQHLVDLPNGTGLGTSVLMSDESTPYYRITAATSVSTYNNVYLFPKIPIGTQCVISSDVRITSAGSVGVYNSLGMQAVPANVWTRISFVFTYDGTSRQTGHTYSGTVLDYRNYKVEIGNIATDWTPAPEDVATDIATAQTAANTANTAINDSTTGLAAKLSRTSASSLAATVTVTTGGSILSGTTTNGTYQSPSGFFGVQGGVVKFSVPISGDPTFAGQLSAAYGSFGAVTIAVGGSLSSGQTAYATGSGYWLENISGVVKFSLGSSTEYLRWSPSAGLELKLATFSVVLSGTLASTVANGSTVYGGLVTATITGGVAPFTYSWSTTADSDGGPLINYGIYSGQGTSATAYRGSATNNRINASITLIVTDSRGFTATGYASHVVTHGTYVP